MFKERIPDVFSLCVKLVLDANEIGSITYRKNVKDTWPQNEFIETEVPVPGGASTRMMLARRETELTADKESIPVTEVRCLTETGHQTAVISTARRLDATVIPKQMPE